MQNLITIKHDRGIVSMARTNDPNSGGSQFLLFIKIHIFLMNNIPYLEEFTESSFETLDKIASIQTGTNDDQQILNK